MNTRALAAVVLVALGGCSGKQGPAGADGKSVLLRTASEAAGTSCASGGVKVESGLDANANGVLDAGEVASTAYVCAGVDGQSVVPSAENPGANCSAGGVALTPGAGSPFYVCNGAAGAAGDSVVVTPEPEGTACPFGGERFQVGSGAPTYACNGAPGAAGESVAMTPEPAGANCEFGGQRLQVGAGSPTYVCNGSPGAAGASVAMTQEPAGANCEFGGQRLQVGSGAFAYVCDGAPGAPGESVTMTPEPAGATCVFGGVRLQVGTGAVSYLCSGAPVGVTLPTVQTAPVTDVRYVAAQVDATVVDDGGEMVLVRGVVLATHAVPTIHDTVYLSGTGAGAFATLCDGLLPATTYSVRAFATNTLGTAYGDERSFTTRALTVPALGTLDASNVTNKTAISGGDITDDGGTPILARGICWSTSPDPTLADACASEGAGAGSFLALATGLTPGTTYHVRAYATNAQGNSYGNDTSFTTVVLPLATVTTAAPSAVSYTAATGGGNVTSDNGAPVTSRGICWATSPAPTTSGPCSTEAGGTGSFTASITGLTASTKYYVRAFAVNGGGTSYGNEVSFTTLAVAIPSLTTKAVTGVSSYIAGSGGTIATDGGSTITAKGVCWSLNPGPTIANSRTTDGTGPASFNSTLTGLVPLTAYYVRAYATNGLGTAYGNEITFTTTDLVGAGPTAPVLGTSPVAMSTSSTATSGGYVSNDGGSAVTARGLCWSTAQNPTLADACSADGGTGVGFFTSTVTGLGGCGVVYYVRAYATNATGTGYGNQVTLSTGLAPTVTTAPITGIGYYDATSGGTIPDDGGCAITQKGVVWSMSQNPTTSGSKTTDGAGAASFVSSVGGLYANRTYYLRAYATNSAGTSYGPQVTFATLEPSTPYVGQSYGGGIVFYVDGTGLHGLIAAPSDQGLATWGCGGTSIPTGTALGTGATNTAAIVASCGTAGIAAKVADNLALNGYSDWFLPSKDELALMLTNLASKGIGAFGTSYPYYYYWTSSQYDGSYAYTAYAFSGAPYYDGKYNSYDVRAVRAF